MYFVLTKRDGYVMFCLAPSERAAIALTDKQVVHLLVREAQTRTWTVAAEWNAADYSHTDFMAAWHHRDEPADPRQLLDVLPSQMRQTALR